MGEELPQQHKGWLPQNCNTEVQEQPAGDSEIKAPILPLASKHPEPAPGVVRTTVLLRNMPNNQTRKMLVQLLNRKGFEGQFDFLYLPIDFQSRISFGYGFVNFVSEESVTRAL